jgi:hypothetical protein
MITNRRSAVSALAVLSLGAAAGAGLAGCGGSASPAASPSRSPGNGKLASVIGCLDAHGLHMPAGSTAPQLRSDLASLPAAQRQRDFDACASQLPARIRQRIGQRLAQVTAPPSATATPSATTPPPATATAR